MTALISTLGKFSFSDILRRNRSDARDRKNPLSRRPSFRLEPIESRLLLSVDFFAATPVAPAVNFADRALGTLGGFVPIEPMVSVNDQDPGNIIATSHIGMRISTDDGQVFAATTNFGNPPGTNVFNGDTDTTFDSTGRLFWVNMAGTGTAGISVNEINPTTGAVISRAVVSNNNDDKPMIVADANPDSPFRDNLYLVWTQFGLAPPQVMFSRSTDHGVNWSAPQQLSVNADDFAWPSDVGVGPNGDVYVTYHSQPGATNPTTGANGQTIVLRSTDGGLTFPQRTLAFTPGNSDISYNVQTDASGQFPGTQFWTQGAAQPWVLPDPVRLGNVYVITTDDPDNTHGAGDDSDIVISRSTDFGQTWTTSTVSSGPANSFQLFSSASIDRFGNIAVAWYDNRQGLTNAGGNFLLDVQATYSIDGGLTWAPEFRVNDAAFDPDPGAVNRFGGPPPTTRIGEYFGIDLYGGTAYVAWNGNSFTGGVPTNQQVLFDSFSIAGSVSITGDENGFAEDDVFTVRRIAGNTNSVEIFLNGQREYAGLLSGWQQLNIFGLGGNDTLIVDSSNGLLTFANGIRYDGGAGFDDLALLQTGGMNFTDTYSVGPTAGSGISTIVGPTGTQVVFFEDLSPVLDLVPTALLTVNATASDNAINYAVGLLAGNGLVTIDEHERIEFANKTDLTINAGNGQDAIALNNPNTPTGLTGITLNGGDPGSGDTLTIIGTGAAVTVDTTTGTITGATGAGSGVSIDYGTLETLDLTADIGDLTIATTDADDTVVVTPGLISGSNSGTVQSSGAAPQIVFVNSGTFTANLAGGSNALVVNGSAAADDMAVSGAAVEITGRHDVIYTGAQALTVNGRGGSDTFDVTPSATVAIFIDGGDPIGALPGDLLNIIAGGGSVTFNAGPEIDEGGFVVDANEPVSFDHIESFGITGPGGGVINGTNGPDAITVIARDDSTHATADGVQDFTVSVNTGPELLFLNTPSLTINALSGSDQVTLQTPAPNNAAWDVDVTVNGGPPAADTDRLIVQTPGADSEAAVYTPIAFDGGTLELTSLSSLITINSTEVLNYDGQDDNDSLTIVGTDGADTIVHNPGTTDQAGSFLVNSLLGLSYQNLGSSGSLTVDGGTDSDTLVYTGTAANDSFTIGAAGQVSLNSRLVLNTIRVETLTLEGFDGDDTFTLEPAISESVYATINLNGGGQSSVTGDHVNLIGTIGDDDIIISGQVVSLGGTTVASSGIEDIRLDALAGVDTITYNGVSGVTENITVSSSGVVGGGQVSVPGVALINFSEVEGIYVDGNTPTPTETDTLTFAGTDAADLFRINLVAAGTETDPILTLQNSAGTPLLVLRSYSNFETLRVLGLNGADTFNVTTAATGPSRNLFVDGGLAAGKKKSTDDLNIYYTPPRPRIIHSAATQDPDAGIVDLNYDSAQFVVQYDGIEQVAIRKR